jgi:anti-sigma B factor antagonist
MERPIDEGLVGDATGGHVADLADHGLVRADFEGRAGTRLELAPAPFEVRRVDHRLGVVLTLRGELDLATVPLVQEKLIDRAARNRGMVVIDLSGLRFIDSSGVRMLVRAERQLRVSGRQLVLVRGPRAVRRVFELTGLDRYFAWCNSPSAALRTTLERCTGPRRVREPAANRPATAELDRELGAVMWS